MAKNLYRGLVKLYDYMANGSPKGKTLEIYSCGQTYDLVRNSDSIEPIGIVPHDGRNRGAITLRKYRHAVIGAEQPTQQEIDIDMLNVVACGKESKFNRQYLNYSAIWLEKFCNICWQKFDKGICREGCSGCHPPTNKIPKELSISEIERNEDRQEKLRIDELTLMFKSMAAK